MRRFIYLLMLLIVGLSHPSMTLATELQTAIKKQADTVAKQASTGSATSDFLYEMRNAGSGAVFGELLKFSQESAADGIRTALKVGGDATLLAARVKVVRDRIAALSGVTGDMLAVIDVSTKLAGEDFEGAAWSAGFTVLGKLVARDSVAKAIGFSSTAPIVAAIAAAQICKASYDAKASASLSRSMESFYGTVTRIGRVRGRSLGELPGPFPSTDENIEKIWQQIIRSSSFREHFGIYVVTDLKEEWPAPGYFASSDTNFLGITTNVTALQQEQLDRLQEQKSQIKLYISSMLASINKPALADEKRVVAVHALTALKNHFAQYGASLEKGLANMENASRRLPEVLSYSRRCDALIRSYIAAKSLDDLSVVLSTINMYVRDVLRWLPAKGVDPAVDEAFEKLVAAYEQASRGKEQLRQEFELTIRTGDYFVDAEVNSKSVYEHYFKSTITAFEWNQSGGSRVVIDKMSQVLADGHFRYLYDRETLIDKRDDYAGSIVRAWEVERYSIACDGGTLSTVPVPEREVTINGFYEAKAERLREIRNFTTDREELPSGVWEGAYKIALEANSVQKKLSLLEHRETTEALRQMLYIYIEQAQKVYARAKQIDAQFQRLGVRAFHDILRSQPVLDKYGPFLLIDKTNPLAIDDLVAELDSSSSDFQAKVKPPLNAIYDSMRILRSQADREITDCNYHKRPLLENAYAMCRGMENLATEWDRTINGVVANIEDIRLFVDPKFMDSVMALTSQREKVPEWLDRYNAQVDGLAQKIESYINVREAWITHSQAIDGSLRAWAQRATAQGVLYDFTYMNAPNKLCVDFYDIQPGAFLFLANPYPHYLTKNDRNQIVADLQSVWQQGGLESFSAGHAPWLQELANAYFQELGQIAVMAENFFIQNDSGERNSRAVTAQSLSDAENIVAAMRPGAADFSSQYGGLSSILPLSIAFPGQQHKEVFETIGSATLLAPLAPRFMEMRELLHKKVLENYVLVEQQLIQKEKEQDQLAQQRLPIIIKELQARIAQERIKIEKWQSFTGGGDSLTQVIADAESSREKLFTEPYREAVNLSRSLTDRELGVQVGTVFSLLNSASADLMNLMQRLKNQKLSFKADIQAFYAEFQHAYQEKNESRLLSFLSDGWEAGDGTTLFDVEDYFHNMFNVFDEISINITNLTIEPMGDNHYRVNYDTLIRSQIYDDDLEHEEKSSVSEEVVITSAGKVIIVRTPQGRFWYVR